MKIMVQQQEQFIHYFGITDDDSNEVCHQSQLVYRIPSSNLPIECHHIKCYNKKKKATDNNNGMVFGLIIICEDKQNWKSQLHNRKLSLNIPSSTSISGQKSSSNIMAHFDTGFRYHFDLHTDWIVKLFFKTKN